MAKKDEKFNLKPLTSIKNGDEKPRVLFKQASYFKTGEEVGETSIDKVNQQDTTLITSQKAKQEIDQDISRLESKIEPQLQMIVDTLKEKADEVDLQDLTNDYNITKGQVNNKISKGTLATINSQSIENGGNIIIESGGGSSNFDTLLANHQDIVEYKQIPTLGLIKNNSLVWKAHLDSELAKIELPNLSNYYNKNESDTRFQAKGDYATKTELNNKQDKLTSGTTIKTINGTSILGSGDIKIDGGGDYIDPNWDASGVAKRNLNMGTTYKLSQPGTPTENNDVANKKYVDDNAGKSPLDDVLNVVSNIAVYREDPGTINNPRGLIHMQEMNRNLGFKQDKLTTENLKTINGESLLGKGNITIESSKITAQDIFNLLEAGDGIEITMSNGKVKIGEK